MTTIVSRWRAHRLDQEDGLSLVELMIALMIMGVALLALASVAAASLVQVRNSRARQQAVDAASGAIERLRLQDFAAVALDGTDPDVTSLGQCAGAFDEPVVTSGVTSSVPFEEVREGNVTVRMFVTWYDDPANGDQTCTAADHDRTVKRVTAVATWTDAGATRSVEQSTLVSNVERGLPAPDFRMGTARVQLNWTREMAIASAEVCTGHVIRNLGAQDGYDWFIERIDGGSPTRLAKKDGTSRAEFKNADGKWTARAFFEYPARTTAVSPATYGVPYGSTTPDPTELPEDVDLMWDHDGNGAPETVHRLDPGEQARIWICYRPDAPSETTSAESYAREYRVTVRSRFDPNRFEQVTHGLSVAPAGNVKKLYLFDDYTGAAIGGSSTRLVVEQGGKRVLPTYEMGPVDANGAQPGALDTTSSVPDHDTDPRFNDTSNRIDAFALRGLRLKPQPNPFVQYRWGSGSNDVDNFDIGFARWHASFAALTAGTAGGRSVTLENQMTLKLWVSTADILGGAARFDRKVWLDVRVQVVNKNERTVASTLIDVVNPLDSSSPPTPTTVPTYTHDWDDDPAFRPVTVTLNLATRPVIQDTQALRLEVRCVAARSLNLTTGPDECVLAYDHTTTPSSLDVMVVQVNP